MIVSKETFERIRRDCENPPPPSAALRKVVADTKARFPKLWRRLSEGD